MMRKNIIIRSFSNAYYILFPSHRKKALISFFLLLIHAVSDVFTLASILPLIFLLMNPEYIHSNQLLNSIYIFFNFKNNDQFLIAFTVFILLLFILKNTMSFYITHFQSRYAYGVSVDLTTHALRRHFSMDYLKFANANSSQILQNIANVPGSFSTNILLALITLITEGVIITLIIAGILIYDFNIFILLVLVLFPAMFWLYHFKKKKLGEINKDLKIRYPKSINYVMQAINGFVDIKMLRKEQHFIKLFSKLNKKLARSYTFLHTAEVTSIKFIEIIAILGITVIFIYAIKTMDNQNEVVMLLTLFAAAAYRVIPSLNRMLVAFMKIKSFQFTIDELKRSKQESDVKPQASPSPVAFREQVLVQDLKFSYPGSTFQLKNVSITIRKGEKVAIVGKSGSGKTTLLLVILRFLKETSGAIRVDHLNLKDDHTEAWRSLIAYVPQNPFIMESSIAENIAMGVPPDQIDYERMSNILEQLDLKDFIHQLPQGYQTTLGVNGVNISGGQKQRIAIARALYQNAQILILDEVTSNLDHKTEQEVISTINKVTQQKTVLIVTHRLQILGHCDKVYHMQDGTLKSNYLHHVDKVRV